MQMIDRDIAKSSALVVDANPTSRGMLVSQLRDFGVGNVVQSSRIHEARRILESRTFDLVLCEQDFEGEGYTGQGLLDDLRRLQLMPLSTAFIIVTGGLSTTNIADAAESAVDTVLLKPYTAATLAERILQVRKRKKSLADLFTPVDAGDYAAAARLCLKRFKAGGAYSAYAARLGCELLLRIGEPEAARKLNEMVLEVDPSLPWARLGVARAQIDAGQPAAAMRTLQALVKDQPTYADALDVLGRLQVDQGDMAAALATCRQAADFTRGSIVRLQRHGLVAFYSDDREAGQRSLDRAAVLGTGSPMFDPQVLMLLAALRFEQRDNRGLQRMLDALLDAATASFGDERLSRLSSTAAILGLAYHQQRDATASALHRWGARLLDPDVDLETACNLLTVWSALAASGTALPPETGNWVDTLAMRFSVSRTVNALLAGATASHPPFVDRLAQAQQTVATLSEQAVQHALDGRPQEAVDTLLRHARRTLNLKFIDLARMTLQRHRERIADADRIAGEIESLRAPLAHTVEMPPLGQVAAPAARTTTAPADTKVAGR